MRSPRLRWGVDPALHVFLLELVYRIIVTTTSAAIMLKHARLSLESTCCHSSLVIKIGSKVFAFSLLACARNSFTCLKLSVGVTFVAGSDIGTIKDHLLVSRFFRLLLRLGRVVTFSVIVTWHITFTDKNVVFLRILRRPFLLLPFHSCLLMYNCTILILLKSLFFF